MWENGELLVPILVLAGTSLMVNAWVFWTRRRRRRATGLGTELRSAPVATARGLPRWVLEEYNS